MLIVDDREANRSLLGRKLLRLGVRVTEAGDGVEALEVLGGHDVDAVCMDVDMPRLNGLETLAAMQADPVLRRIPVLMISGMGRPEAMLEVRIGLDVGPVVAGIVGRSQVKGCGELETWFLEG